MFVLLEIYTHTAIFIDYTCHTVYNNAVHYIVKKTIAEDESILWFATRVERTQQPVCEKMETNESPHNNIIESMSKLQ